MKKNKISKNWINKQKRDIFVRQSKIEGYRSRAVYKLQEIDEKFKILKNGISLVDLGAAPGSWSQYVAKKVKSGKILSIDLNEFDQISGVSGIAWDVTINAILLSCLEDINELTIKKRGLYRDINKISERGLSASHLRKLLAEQE